jgi:hypothetical protein
MGPWIQTRRGLRQGHPLSPLLFLIVADILQETIQSFSKEGALKHPIVTNLSCPVIQYAYVTLIIFQGTPDQTRLLKEILEAFSRTTGLKINYDKSTLVPISLSNEDQIQISNILECPIASFPQTCLGIPMSNPKLPKWALSPFLHSLDIRIGTLAIKGATSGGCLTLTKSVHSALPAHLSACIKASKWFY